MSPRWANTNSEQLTLARPQKKVNVNHDPVDSGVRRPPTDGLSHDLAKFNPVKSSNKIIPQSHYSSISHCTRPTGPCVKRTLIPRECREALVKISATNP